LKSVAKLFGAIAVWVAVVAGVRAADASTTDDAGVIYSLVGPAKVEAGAPVEVRVAALNAGEAAVRVDWPETIEVRVTAAGGERNVRATRRGARGAAGRVEPGSFALGVYEMALTEAAGMAVLEWRGGRTAVEVGGASEGERVAESAGVAAEQKAEESVTRRPPTNLVRSQQASGIRRMFADRLGPHEPIYFVYGTEAPAAKFQVSFKYKLLDFREVAPQRMTRTLQLAYTQRSLWDIDGRSSPFYDTSYMPELIYEALAPRPEDSERWFTWLGVQAAFKHESNGRDGPVSRSLNMLYVRPVFALGQLDGWHLLAIPEVFTYVGTLEDNPDVEDYRGHGRLTLVLGRNDGPSLMATWWAGDDFEHDTVQLDLTVPIRTRLLDFETYLLVQYFNGYGESLLSYREKVEVLRAGISLVR